MNMETIAYSPQKGKTLSYLLAAIFLTVATGAVLSARASNRATWTGEAGNGLFQDSGNWTCFNESGEQVAGVPAADAAITLAADVPANGWADANFAAMSGPIDLAGHSLTVPKTFFDGATPALTDLIVNGDFETDRLTDGKTSEKMLPTSWAGSSGYVYVTSNDTNRTYNNNKLDNGCYVVGNRWIAQTFTLPEDAVLSLSFDRISLNTSQNTYRTSNGNVQIDDSQVYEWTNGTGYGKKSYSTTFALAAGTHTIKFEITSNNGSTFDNISLTYRPSARTVTDSVGGGELHVNVPEGETATNVDVNMTGHLKLVKEGAGAFVSQRNALTYDSGTIVAAGTLSTTEGAETGEAVNRAFGALGSFITVRTGATLLNGGDGCDFCNYNVVLDGGRLAAGADGTLVEINGTCSVSVGANGGTLDNGGFAVTVAADIAGTGALVFAGSGTTALSAGVSMACPSSVASGVTLSVPGTDTATFGSLTLAGGSTLDLAAYVGGVTPLAATALNLPASGTVGLTLAGGAFEAGLYAICANDSLGPGDGSKFAPSAGELECAWSVDSGTLLLVAGTVDPGTWTGLAGDGNLSNSRNWYGGEVPTAGVGATIKCNAPETLTVGAIFAPSSIVFPAGCAALAIEGNAITGISAVTNFSDATQTFNAPVVFKDKILVVQSAVDWTTREQSSVRFAGGVTGTDFAEDSARYLNGAYTLTAAEDWIANTQGNNDRWGIPEGSSISLPFASDTSELALGEHSDVVGGAFTAAVVRTSARICRWNLGEYVVTNELAVTLTSDVYISSRGSDGAFKIEKMTIGGSANKWFYFANSGMSGGYHYFYDKNIYIGSGGLNFAEDAHVHKAYCCGHAPKDVIYIRPWHSDYAIGTKPGSEVDISIRQATHFGTTDENGVARTVTANGIFGGEGALYIEGTGRFVVNNANTMTGAVNVNDTATLAINEGKVLTSGKVTVDSGATLEIASGVNTFGGLDLKKNSTVIFKFTNRAVAPQIAIADGKTLTANGAVTVKIPGDVRPTGGVKVLTTCGGFGGVSVTLADGAPHWVRDLSVNEDGNIVLDVKPQGTKIIVR